MKIVLFIYSLVVSSVALSAQQISGMIEREGFRAFLIIEQFENQPYVDECPRFQVDTSSNHALRTIKKLGSGDAITASGTLHPDSCKVTVDSVDYVGLKKLIGYWHSSEGIIKVHDFTSISVFPTAESDFYKLFNSLQTIDYRYSITPTNGKEWVVFISNAAGTTFATIDLKQNSAILKIHDSENGSILKTLQISKWGEL